MRRGAALAGQYLLVLWLAATINFALPHLAPGEPVDYLYGGDAVDLSASQRAAIEASYGLDASVPEQYGAFWVGLVHGDLGTSVALNRPVTEVLAERLPWTLVLAGTGLVLAVAIGALTGAWAAWRRDTRSDRAAVGGILAIDAMPGFWIAMILISVFSVRLGWFPSFGAVPLSAEGLGWWSAAAARLVLPVATLAVATSGTFFLLTRASMTTVLDEAYLRFAPMKGISATRVVLGHGLRTALLPVYTNLTVAVGTLLSGAVVVESVFAYPGVGTLIAESVTARDYPVLQGAFLLLTVMVIAVNLLADLTYPRLDPRVRRARRAQRGTPAPTGKVPA